MSQNRRVPTFISVEGEKGNKKMAGLAVHITVEVDDGRPVSLARVRDAEILRCVARAAIDRARASAARIGGIDWLLGQMRTEEARLSGGLLHPHDTRI